MPALDTLYAADFEWRHRTGERDTRSSWLAFVADSVTYREHTARPEGVVMFAHSAWVTGRLTSRRRDLGATEDFGDTLRYARRSVENGRHLAWALHGAPARGPQGRPARSCGAWTRSRRSRRPLAPRPCCPMRPGQPERHTHDYVRHGTRDLFAALDVKSGTVIGEVHQRDRSEEFRQFLDTVDAHTPPEFELHLVLDNASTHKTERIKPGSYSIRGCTCTSPRPARRGAASSSAGARYCSGAPSPVPSSRAPLRSRRRCTPTS